MEKDLENEFGRYWDMVGHTVKTNLENCAPELSMEETEDRER